MSKEYGDGYIAGYLDGKLGRDYNSQDRKGEGEVAYFDGFGAGREDREDRGEWTRFTYSPAAERTHCWKPFDSHDLGQGIEERTDACMCGAKRYSLVMSDKDGNEVRRVVFRTEPNPLPYCPHS